MNGSKWIDLSHTISSDTLPYPKDPSLVLEKNAKKDRDDFVLSRLTTGLHLGTHVDSFAHLLEGGQDIASLTLNRFFGEAAIVKVKANNGIIRTEDVALIWDKLENKPDILLLETGHSHLFDTKEYYTECPGFVPGFADFLANAGIRLIGVDLPTVKYGVDGNAAMHRDLFEKEILIVESLANLNLLPGECFFFALPIKLKGAEASLVRAMALVK